MNRKRLFGDGNGHKTCEDGVEWEQGLRAGGADGNSVVGTGWGWGRTTVPVQLSNPKAQSIPNVSKFDDFNFVFQISVSKSFQKY